jgi:hypothetical protein
MKLQNIFRMQTIVISLGAALFLATSAQAQEITNTSFDEGPNVVAFAQPAPAPAASNLSSPASNSPAMTPGSAMISTPIVVQESAASLWTPVEGWLFAAFLFCTALISLYALVEAKRANRNFKTRVAPQVNREVALH